MRLDVIGFGALNVDRLYKVNKIAAGGEEAFIIDVKDSPGGSAANTVVGLARLGLRSGYVGKVANDSEGRFLINDFKKENVDVDGIVISKEGRSGIVTGFVDLKGERALYVDPGVNDSLRFEEIDLEYLKRAEFLHLTSFIGEKPFEAQKKLLQTLRNLKISFDPGMIYTRKGLKALNPIIKRTSVMFLNNLEIELLTAKSYKKGSKLLMRKGVEIVAVKLGEKGCYVANHKESYKIEPNRVKVVDTTGAGDAFCAGFLYGLVNNKDLYECGKLGNFVASRCIRKIGCRSGLPRVQELKGF